MEHDTLDFFVSGAGERVTRAAMAEAILGYFEENCDRRYTVTIGTDSAMLRGHVADFVTAIVVRRVGSGGRYFWRRTEGKNIHTLRERIIREAFFSIEVAKEILENLREREFSAAARGVHLPVWDFEIHVDVGMNGATHTMLQEVVGIVRANNFEVRTKPESYAASKVADRHVMHSAA